ncbi:unnamed protein product [Schistosoma curassoni]|nr:unnamed protein product [Schistosoma curassoni]
MKFVALVSGGKDSIYNIMECIVHGHSLVALVNLCPPRCGDKTSEIDSYMYQSVGSEAIGYISSALKVPLYQTELRRVSHCRRMLYRQCSNDEVEDLYDILCKVLSEIPDVTAVSSGAILSDYQRYRVENVTRRLGLRSLCFLWQRSQEELLEDIVSAGLDAIIIKIAALGLTVEDFLGVHLSSIAYKLRQLSVPPWSLNVCGEGGEFETITLDCPIFHSKIELKSEPEIVTHSKDPFSPTAYLRLRNLILEAKPLNEVCRTSEQLLSLKGKHNNEGNTSTHERSPFVTPFERLKSIRLKTCEEIKGDVTNALVQKTNINCNNDNHQKYYEFDRKSINNFARSLGNGMYITSNYYGTGEKVDEIHKATEDAFSQMKNVFTLNEIKPQQIVQFIVVLSQRLSPDVFSNFNEAYTGQLNRWLEEIEIDSNNLKTEYIDSYMPTRVCICVNSLSNETVYCSDKVLTISLSAIVYYGDINVFEWINSLRGLYVQSISHWAPANIGPYSQAIAVPISNIQLDDFSTCVTDYFTFYSGQIGLIPELEVIPSETGYFSDHFEALEVESWLSLRHCHRIMKYMAPSNIWMDLFLGICYAIDEVSLNQARNCFHQAVCSQTLDTTDKCHCNQCIVWLVVSSLPKNATVEWQWITGPSSLSLVITSLNKVLNRESIIPSNTFMLFYRYDVNGLNVQELSILLSDNYTGFMLPVVKFTDPSVTAVVVSVHSK